MINPLIWGTKEELMMMKREADYQILKDGRDLALLRLDNQDYEWVKVQGTPYGDAVKRIGAEIVLAVLKNQILL